MRGGRPVETCRDSKHCLVLGDVPDSPSRRRARHVLGVRRHGVWDRNRPWTGEKGSQIDYVISSLFAICHMPRIRKSALSVAHPDKVDVSHLIITETSKRGTTRKRESIKHKVSEHQKKTKKQARKDKAAGKRALHLVSGSRRPC